MKPLKIYKLFHYAIQNLNTHLSSQSREYFTTPYYNQNNKYDVDPLLLKWYPSKSFLLYITRELELSTYQFNALTAKIEV